MADFAAKLQAHLARQEARTATLRRIGDKALAITRLLPPPVFVRMPPESAAGYVACQWHTSSVLYKCQTVSVFFGEECVTVGSDNQQRFSYDQAEAIVERVRELIGSSK